MSKSSTNIVLVGAGAGGFLAYKALAAKLSLNTNLKLVVIEPRKFYVHLPSTLRMVVSEDGGLENRSIMDHPASITSSSGKNNTRFVYAKVTSIVEDHGNGGQVTLDNGETIDFSILVLATGSSWSGPIGFSNDKDQILQSVHSWRKRFQEAEDVVLVGGGAVGVELSGEIKDVWPDKRVTIVHNHALPLNDAYPDRWRKEIAGKAQNRGTTLVLDDSIQNLEPKDGVVLTRKGKTIRADLVVPTFGGRPNTSFVKTLDADVLTDTGYVRVRPTLQVDNHPRIFALGDIINWKEEKQAAKAMDHVPIVVNNVIALANGQTKFKEYKGAYEIIALTNGKTRGTSYVGMLWGIILGDRLTSSIKGKTLLIDMSKSKMGL